MSQSKRPKKIVPFTPDNAIKAVSREFGLDSSKLKARVDDPENITVFEKSREEELVDGDHNGFNVCTREVAEIIELEYIEEVIMEDNILYDLCLPDEKIISVLADQVAAKELGPWITSRTRLYVRDLARHNIPEFWRLWRKAGLKPSYVENRRKCLEEKRVGTSEDGDYDVFPSFELMKDLQDYMVGVHLSNPIKSVRVLVEDDHLETEADVFLSQCHFDVKQLARAFFEAAGGLSGFSSDKITHENFVIYDADSDE